MSRHPTIPPKKKPFIEELLDPQVGDLVKLYNLYREIVIEEPSVIGLYMGKGYAGQFSYYEILVVQDNEFTSFFHSDGIGAQEKVHRYLINDFLMCKCA